MRFTRQTTLVSLMLAVLGVAGVWTAALASAHVTVAAPGVTVGASDAAITFRVPNESAAASTVGFKLQLPIDHPIAGVLVAPQPGWTAQVTQKKLTTPIKTDDGDISEVVSEIDWTAQSGAGIKPGYFGEFTIIGGKLPDNVPSLTFKAIQRYSDGKTVAWIQEPAPGSNAEPDLPAPVLELTANTDSSSAAASAAPSGTATPSTAAAGNATGASKAAATTGIALGIVGVLLGGAALLLTLARRRSQ